MSGRYELRDPGLLKLALGAPVNALAAGQLELHRHALARYKRLAAAINPDDAGNPRALVLQAGIGHEREYVRFWASLLPGADASDLPLRDPARSAAPAVEAKGPLEVA